MRRRVLCAVAAVLIAAPAPAALGDADPPSDYLYGVANDLYLPADISTPQRETVRLQRLLARARAIGHPYKLAIIATRADLGAVPVYIDKPQAYAKFLYGEIGFNLAPQQATLLVVLPSGLGIAGKDAAVGRGVISKMRVPANATTTQLAHVAASAIQAVATANGHPIKPPSPHKAGTGGGVGWWVWVLLFLAALGAARLVVIRRRARAE